jgi:hydrogenase expression/formation protein HypE
VIFGAATPETGYVTLRFFQPAQQGGRQVIHDIVSPRTALGEAGKRSLTQWGKPGSPEDRIRLSHGSGGKATRNLITGLFAQAFSNPLLDPLADSASMPLADSRQRLAFTTDSWVVDPLFFPGGDIGRLAVHGTINDLAMAGARPAGLSAAVILEEGLPMAVLSRVVASMQAAAESAGVPIVAGDTRVVDRGSVDRMFISTAGIGLVGPGTAVSTFNARPGDRVLVSGPLGDHGMAVMAARGAVEAEVNVASDTAALHGLAAALLAAVPGVRCLKDPTRGGLATSLSEIALHSKAGILVEAPAIPVRPGVRIACQALGLDPLTVASAGRLIAIVAPEAAEGALDVFRAHPLGCEAAIIGSVCAEPAGVVLLRAGDGATRVLELLTGDALARIC